MKTNKEKEKTLLHSHKVLSFLPEQVTKEKCKCSMKKLEF